MAVARSILLARAVSMSRTGEALRIREAAGVPLAAVATDVDSSAATLSRWERGLSRPSGETAVRWVHLLDALGRVN